MRIIFCFIVLALSFFVFFSGCSSYRMDEYFHTISVPNTFQYHGKYYESAKQVIVDEHDEQIPNKLSYLGKVYLDLSTLSETDSESFDITFDVYSIKGIDIDQAIAVKILMVSEDEKIYRYFRYQSKSLK